MEAVMHLRMGCCLLAVFLVACLAASASTEESRPPIPAIAPFTSALNERDLSPYRVKGRASITGQAFLVTRLNKVFVQPGGVVILLPMTRQTREWFERVVRLPHCHAEQELNGQPGRDIQSQPPACGREAILTLLTDKRLAAYVRTTRANPTGHFWFTKLPPGRYYIISPIAGGNDHSREVRTDGTAWTLVEVEWEERVTNVVVTDQSRN